MFLNSRVMRRFVKKTIKYYTIAGNVYIILYKRIRQYKQSRSPLIKINLVSLVVAHSGMVYYV